jgi:hypothetical protein
MADDAGTYELIYATASHVTSRPSISDGSLISHLVARRDTLKEEIDELNRIIQECEDRLQ